ncbi:MAG: hypothetical protein HC915_17000 [Anaerolineae bacterium]|nr:hypothetical protein [Anaerolineae bacterium]
MNLLKTLQGYDIELLEIIADRWDVDLASRDPKEAAKQLVSVMLAPENATREWERLEDDAYNALQSLLTAPEARRPLAMVARLYQDIRQMGPELLKKEKPHLNPLGAAEKLYYHGFVSVTYDQAQTGTQAFAYVPTDLATVLPTRKTRYALTTTPPNPTSPRAKRQPCTLSRRSAAKHTARYRPGR